MVDKLFPATKAFIIYRGKILLLRESSAYKDGTNLGRYDVPGGRVIPGQVFHKNLKREIKEETGLEVKVGRPFHVGEWRPKIQGERWQIVGTFFECLSDSDGVVLSEDHDQYIWIDPRKYRDFNLIPNLKEAFESYLTLNNM
jgi:8-oxo-dGTP diphosphatase